MAKIELNYNNIDIAKPSYDSLNNIIGSCKKHISSTKEEYEEIDSSILETKSFPLNKYIDDFYSSIEYVGNLIDIGNELADYTVNTFKGAEEAIEADINKFRTKMSELFGSTSYDGFHFNSESIVYWEPGIEGYTAQGYTTTSDYKIISAYKKDSNSRLYYYDIKTGEYIGYVELNNQAHVGGTAYDPDHNLIFVTGSNGKVNCYDHEAIEQVLTTGNKQSSQGPVVIDLNTDKYKGIEVNCDINIKDELRTDDPATIYYHNGKLYVSTYRAKGDLVSYDISCDRKEEGTIKVDAGQMNVVSHNCPSATQGIAIFERNGKSYVAFSRSATFSPSSIDVYELNDDGTLGKMSGTRTFPHQGLEGIEVNEDGSVTGIYEYEGSTSLDTNIDNIIDNGQENPHNADYLAKATIWNKYIHGLDNASYDEALRNEQLIEMGYYNNIM